MLTPEVLNHGNPEVAVSRLPIPDLGKMERVRTSMVHREETANQIAMLIQLEDFTQTKHMLAKQHENYFYVCFES